MLRFRHINSMTTAVRNIIATQPSVFSIQRRGLCHNFRQNDLQCSMRFLLSDRRRIRFWLDRRDAVQVINETAYRLAA
jgi:hypothetical protein